MKPNSVLCDWGRLAGDIAKVTYSIGLAIVLVACAAPARTTQLDGSHEPSDRQGYYLPVNNGSTLVLAVFSGGGSRASALAAGALRAFANTDATVLPQTDPALIEGQLDGDRNRDSALEDAASRQVSLDEHIDIISAVSGGSVTAAHFALFGSNGIDDLRDEFLYQNIIGEAVSRTLNPFFLISLATEQTSRADIMVDIFEDRLFSDEVGEPYSFRHLMRDSDDGGTEPRRPFIILNTTDMAIGTAFPLTQDWFDLLCADLTQFTIPHAVSASSAFPVLLSPITVRNFSHSSCDAHNSIRDAWPDWVNQPLTISEGPYHDPERHRNATVQSRYLNADDGVHFVHLLDGGISDNIGALQIINLFRQIENRPGAIDYMADVERVILLLVNARSENISDISERDDVPGMLDMLSSSIDGGIDGASFSRIARLRRILTREIRLLVMDALLRQVSSIDPAKREKCEESSRENSDTGGDTETCDKLKDHLDRLQILEETENLPVYFIPVDFDYIEVPECRAYLKRIGTSWSLPTEDIDLLLRVGEQMVYSAPDYRRLVEDLEYMDRPGLDDKPSTDAARKPDEGRDTPTESSAVEPEKPELAPAIPEEEAANASTPPGRTFEEVELERRINDAEQRQDLMRRACNGEGSHMAEVILPE